MLSIPIKYAFFALVATLTNIGTQYLCLRIYHDKYSLYLAMLFGTFAGLIVKYILDKKYIFYFDVRTIAEDTRKFILYSVTGVFTTLIFWGFEVAFNFLFSFDGAKYIGAIIGLAIGYLSKYKLDKKHVFVPPMLIK